jgi:phosphoenolpyruvate carboxylase
MRPIFNAVPKRRDRRQHIGLLAYSRSLGEQTLPRAITFTAAFYSIGVPPEFIGLGRTLERLRPKELELLKTEYPNLITDIVATGRFLNKSNLAKLAKTSSAWRHIRKDVEATEKILSANFQPQSKDEITHQLLSSRLLNVKTEAARTKLIANMGVLRKSLG